MLRTFLLGLKATSIVLAAPRPDYSGDCEGGLPDPPSPEPIDIVQLPLPPVTQDTTAGGCTVDINPRRTGCIGRTVHLEGGSFLSDGKHVIASVNFTGASAAPDSASIYNGVQVIIIKTDGDLFTNGDPWKCITCGNSPNNSYVASQLNTDWTYAQAFADGKRILAGQSIISCSEDLVSDACTPDKVSVYPIRLGNTVDDSGSGFRIRELRLHPDQVHIGFSSFAFTAAGTIGQLAFFGRLSFNSAPKTGSSLFPRYDVVNANLLFDRAGSEPIYADGDRLYLNHSAITVGELRGFTGTGREITYIGSPVEACNIDVFAVDIFDGQVRRLTSHPGYTDPVEFAPNDEWFVVMDTRGTGRVEFMDGLRWLPPVADGITVLACASVRNNGDRRFFQPWLLDRYGDRGDYYGQSLNNAHLGELGSGATDDPQWNGRADPWFSPDGTQIAFWQAQTVPPACGGENPLPCFGSTEEGRRDSRFMLATRTTLDPLPPREPVEEAPDVIEWAIQYTAGMELPSRGYLREGNYVLEGDVSGSALVQIIENEAKTAIRTVNMQLSDYADEEGGVINGYQNITSTPGSPVETNLDWYANLTRTGSNPAVQYTSEDGFHMSIDVLSNIFTANGTLVTVAGGITYTQPVNGG